MSAILSAVAAAALAGSASAGTRASAAKALSGKLCVLNAGQLPSGVDPICHQHKTIKKAYTTTYSAGWGSPGSSLATTHTITVIVVHPNQNAAQQLAAAKKHILHLTGAKSVKVGSLARAVAGTAGVTVMFLASGYECSVAFVNHASSKENAGHIGEIVQIAKTIAKRL